MTWKDPGFDFPNIQSVLRHVYLDGLSGNKTGIIAGGGTVRIVTTASPDPSSIICHNSGKAGHCRSDCAVPAKAHRKSTSPPDRIRLGDEKVALGKSGVLCIMCPRTSTPRAKYKEILAHRRVPVVRTRWLW